MDFLDLLIPKEKVIGIEIGERKLRMIRLEKDSFGNVSVSGKSEIELAPGIIIFGRVADKKKLSESLAKLKRDFKPKNKLSQYAIVTISQNGIYSDVLELPANLSDEQTVEAVSLNAAASLPWLLAECYIDWQAIEKSGNKKKLLISVVPKEAIDSYAAVLKENDFKLIALEPASLSIARIADISDEPVLFFYLTDQGITSVIYNHKNPCISRFESWREASGGKEIKSLTDLNGVLKKKEKNLVSYFENQYAPAKIKKILLMSEGFETDRIIKNVDLAEKSIEKAKSAIPSIKNYDWMVAAGAAARAFIPRSEDTIISLLPVGTESLYETEKATSFMKSIMAVAFSLSIFYIAIFSATYLLISYQAISVARQVEMQSNMPMPVEYAQLEKETAEFNSYVKDLAEIYPKTAGDSSAVLEDINKVFTLGVAINNLSFSSSSSPIAISGVAVSRDNLNAFKFRLENSGYFRDVKFSVQNIAQKNNIPFSASFYSIPSK